MRPSVTSIVVVVAVFVGGSFGLAGGGVIADTGDFSIAPPAGPVGFKLVALSVDADGALVKIGPSEVTRAGRRLAVGSIRPSDGFVDSNGKLVLVEEGADLGGRILVHDLSGATEREVHLDVRPLRGAIAGDRIALLTHAGTSGFHVKLLDRGYNDAGGFAVSFSCAEEHTPLVDLAADGEGNIYVGNLACDGGYAINHYDLQGNLLRVLKPASIVPNESAARRPVHSLTPGATDLFMYEGRIGVLLNRRLDERGVAAELWDRTGAGSTGPFTLTGVQSALAKVAEIEGGQIVVANARSGEMVQVSLAERLGDGR